MPHECWICFHKLYCHTFYRLATKEVTYLRSETSTLFSLLYKTDLKFCEIFTVVQRRKDHFLFVWALDILSTKSSTINFLSLGVTEESFIICNLCISWRSDYLLYWHARISTSQFLALKTTNSVYFKVLDEVVCPSKFLSFIWDKLLIQTF